MGAELVFAHGIGGAKDLPIPAEYAIAGAGAALAVSFIVLALAWRNPRFDGRNGGRTAPDWLAALVDSQAFAWGLRGLGFAFFLYVGWTAIAGPDLLVNPTFGVFYVILWVGLVPASLAFGPFYKAVNPVRTIHLLFSKATGGDPEEGLVELPRLGRPVAGCPGAVRVRLAGAGLPVLDVPRAGAAVDRGLHRDRGARRQRSSAAAGSTGRTRSRPTPRWSADSRSSVAARTAPWCCAAR